ncbi:MAG: hypothetical protein EBZ60_09110, partial [Betaproteobacteria bacterium]|nr:hypothetical protein [Betaproteobacteria bacterium]
AWLQSRWVTVQRQQPQPLAGIAYLVEQCQLSLVNGNAIDPSLKKQPSLENMLMMFERLEWQRIEQATKRAVGH